MPPNTCRRQALRSYPRKSNASSVKVESANNKRSITTMLKTGVAGGAYFVLGLGGLFLFVSGAFGLVGDEAMVAAGYARYGLPEEVTNATHGHRYAFPGETIQYIVAQQSMPFEVTFEPAVNQHGKQLLGPWHSDYTQVGNHSPRSRETICDYYIDRNFSHRGPCTIHSDKAQLEVQLVNDKAIEESTVSFTVATGHYQDTVSFRVSSPSSQRSEYRGIFWTATFGAMMLGAFGMIGAWYIDP